MLWVGWNKCGLRETSHLQPQQISVYQAPICSNGGRYYPLNNLMGLGRTYWMDKWFIHQIALSNSVGGAYFEPGGLTRECWRPQPVGLGSEGIPAATENFEIVKLGKKPKPIGEVFIYFCLKLGGGRALKPLDSAVLVQPLNHNGSYDFSRALRFHWWESGEDQLTSQVHIIAFLVNVIYMCLAGNDSVIFAATRNSVPRPHGKIHSIPSVCPKQQLRHRIGNLSRKGVVFYINYWNDSSYQRVVDRKDTRI